jgi:hypothetical protein
LVVVLVFCVGCVIFIIIKQLEMKNLLISGNTLQEWNVEQILTNKVKSKNQLITEMVEYEWDNTVSRCGLTYLELEQLNNLYTIK